jgi:protease I
MIQKQKRVALLIAPSDFRDEEYFQPKVMLEAVGIQVSTVAKGNPDEVTGTNGGKAHIDAKFEDLTAEHYDGLVLVGGKGAYQYFDDSDVHALVQAFCELDKPVGAICIAPVILAKAGSLLGKRATVFPDGENDLEKEGALCIKKIYGCRW